jgi:hypothetical protein
MANIKISAAAQDNFNKIKIGDRVLSWSEYDKFFRYSQQVMDEVSASIKKVLDDFKQFEEDNKDGFYSFKEKYSNYLKAKKDFIEPRYSDFISFWIEYNFEYLDLRYHNYNDNKYKLEPRDFYLYIEYEALRFFNGKTIKEALEVVWKEHDKNRSSPTAAKSLDNRAVEEKKQKQPTDKALNSANSKVNIFDNIFKVRKNITDSLHDFESKEIRGFNKRTLERAIKLKCGNDNMTIKSYVELYLSDNLSDKKKSINN